ncbi:hypothetical protein F5148DRAFT_201581 [Russula earlei]|uniref:Uncharacterized protein n=1 Tax=Russula earlei TaxID=71964 RepID=A0ACC0UL46_9AGAM|nr:hypothetical protein F5148DRAFT_201581 [Russula earlei]
MFSLGHHISLMHLLRNLLLVFLELMLSALIATSQSPRTALGRTCSVSSNRLDPRTRRFISDCDAQTFCSGTVNGTCAPRRCRREEFPVGYRVNQTMPALCPTGSFCPDEGDACRPLVPVGQPCQFNRDDECAPSNIPGLADVHNFDGSICLHSVCTYANVTEKQPCIFELSQYPDIAASGMGFLNTIVRDNCQTARFFCDATTQLCEPLRLVGQPCQYHRDCKSYNCVRNICSSPPEEPFEVALWQYAVTTLALVLAMAAICIMLVMMHRRHRLKHYQEIYDYCDEQIRLRQSALGFGSARLKK